MVWEGNHYYRVLLDADCGLLSIHSFTALNPV